jgi:hypothetical protein
VIATASGAALATKVSVNFEKEKKLKGYNWQKPKSTL